MKAAISFKTAMAAGATPVSTFVRRRFHGFTRRSTLLALVTLMVAPPNAGSSQDTSAAFESLLTPTFGAYRSGGVVLVAKDDTLLFRRAFGMASVELDVPMRPDHVFGVGSITKQITAAAILQLVARGALSLDADVRRYVPEMLSNREGITIEQLLTHTSGLPNVVDRTDFDAVARLDYTVAQLWDLTKGMPPRFEPGTGFHYSDSGYFLLGAIIERVSGLSYGTYVEQHLFRPLGMHNSWQADGRRVIPRVANGYSIGRGALVPPAPISMTVPYAAGGVFSTVDDLWLWDKAIRGGRVIGEALLRRAWSPRVLPDGSTSGYGYGWKVCTLAGRPTLEHGGFVNGFQSSLLHLPDDRVTVIVLVNNDGDAPDAGATARRVARLLVTGSPDVRPYALTEHGRAAFVGRYRTSTGETREIRDDAGQLSEVYDTGRRRLVPVSATKLAWVEGEESIALNFEGDGIAPFQRYRSSLRCEPRGTATRQS